VEKVLGNMIETTQDPIEQFEKILDSIIDEGENTLFSSDSEEQKQALEKLNLLMKNHFPAGVNGVNGLESLEGIIDDPNLNDQIREIGKKNSDTCIRPLIMAYIQDKKPNMVKRINTGDMKMSTEGNQFAQAVRKAKAAGMKPGDKFKVGDKEYTLKDAMDMAGISDVLEVTSKPMMINGKEVDPNSIEYDMQDYGDMIAPITAAKFKDGTELNDDEMADLEASGEYLDWVRIDWNDRAVSILDNVNIDDEYRFRDWLKKTHNKEVHQLTPQEYIVISKQYRDEKGKKESYHPGEGSAEELAKEIWNNTPAYHDEYKDWKEYMDSEDFEMDADKLRSKFENKKEDLHKGTTKVEELVKSFYDYTTNKFPKGETAVITAVQKQYGDAAAKTAIETIKTLQSGQDKEIERIKQLAGYSTKK
jgi:hypothetical protein